MSGYELSSLPPRDITDRQDLMHGLVKEAGALALQYFRDQTRLQIESKGTQDFVTAADRAVENMLVGRIGEAFPDDAVIGEEGGVRGEASDGRAVWIIDPIDGTSNFARGLPFWAVSVALMVGGEIELGWILDPVTGELFSARRGAGCRCDGQPARVSDVISPERARINLGFTFRRKPEFFLTAIDRMVANKCDWTRLGSAALSLAYVACGRLDGYWAPFVNAWDVAAGICLVKEAGGFVSGFLDGDGLRRGNPILAATPGMADFFRSHLHDLEG
ncbi:inositol monophosphatase family protein [Telmatospirillum siberiense]|uniref:Inositol-1-monophosphatase n=1 Tax=Telmatospirillum siberiense TaxID=382514 RepID=A0A2N3PTG8_9PROT|nr:inositol monophosphatase family protein [Telmatospirillum siberiense]PKU23693.1 inositol monophosphatase [Telmatospirillum siberiense]